MEVFFVWAFGCESFGDFSAEFFFASVRGVCGTDGTPFVTYLWIFAHIF